MIFGQRLGKFPVLVIALFRFGFVFFFFLKKKPKTTNILN